MNHVQRRRRVVFVDPRHRRNKPPPHEVIDGILHCKFFQRYPPLLTATHLGNALNIDLETRCALGLILVVLHDLRSCCSDPQCQRSNSPSWAVRRAPQPFDARVASPTSFRECSPTFLGARQQPQKYQSWAWNYLERRSEGVQWLHDVGRPNQRHHNW